MQVCKIWGYYEFTRLIVSHTCIHLFSVGYKFFLVRYLKKTTSINISPCRIQICNSDFAPNSSYHYNLPNRSAIRVASDFNNFIIQQSLQGVWISEISKICHAVCIFITLILHEITRTMTTKYLAERSPVIFEYEVNIRVSRRHSDSIKWNRNCLICNWCLWNWSQHVEGAGHFWTITVYMVRCAQGKCSCLKMYSFYRELRLIWSSSFIRYVNWRKDYETVLFGPISGQARIADLF